MIAIKLADVLLLGCDGELYGFFALRFLEKRPSVSAQLTKSIYERMIWQKAFMNALLKTSSW